MYIKRHIEKSVLELAEEKGAVLITGARQVGKAMLIEHLKPEAKRVKLDYLPVRRSAVEEPSAFLQLNPPPLFIDEAQHAPELLPPIKADLDRSGHVGDYFLTGSQSLELTEDVHKTLDKQAGILQLLGLSLREMREEAFHQPFLPTKEYLKERKENKKDLLIRDVWETIHRGSLPELFLDRDYDWEDYYEDYVRTYIERDVRALTQVLDDLQFLRFMTACAAMTGQMLNMASLARDVDVSEPTAKRWLLILVTSGIVYLLKPHTNNTIKRAIKTPKLYFLDTGLAAYLTRWLTPETLSTGAMNAQFFESFVVAELLKSYSNAGIEPDLYYVRDGNGREIDLMIFQDKTVFPLQVKLHSSPKPRDITSFEMLKSIKGVKVGEGGVICLSNELLLLADKHNVIPLWAI